MVFDACADPAVRAWCEGFEPPADARLYVQEVVKVSGLVSVAEVCMPRLIEVDGVILIESRYDPAVFADWQGRLGDDRAALAKAVNNFVVWDELRADGERVDEVDDMAAEFVAACWRQRAAEEFPGRDLVVEVVDQYGPTVVMYERQGPPADPSSSST